MGKCCSNEEETEDTNTDILISNELQRDCQIQQQMRKLLIFGCDGVGKSTLFKQLSCLYGYGFRRQTRLMYKEFVYLQCLSDIKVILKLLRKKNQIDSAINTASTILQSTNKNSKITKDIGGAIKSLWHRNITNDIYAHRNMYDLNIEATSKYFWDNIDRISSDNYIPTDKDIIYVRSISHSGLTALTAEIRTYMFHMININDQVNWQKWINIFDQITCIIFVVSLECYDTFRMSGLKSLVYGYISGYCDSGITNQIPDDIMYLILTYCGNDGKCKMVKQLELFEGIINHNIFRNTPVLVYLNKKDIFYEKLKTTPITVCSAFEDYNGNMYSYKESIRYIKQVFRRLNHRNHKQLCIFELDATNGDDVKNIVIESSHHIINNNYKQDALV